MEHAVTLPAQDGRFRHAAPGGKLGAGERPGKGDSQDPVRPPTDDRSPQQAELADGAEVAGQACPFLVGERGEHGGSGLNGIKDNEDGQPHEHGQADSQEHGSPADRFSFLVRGGGQAIAVQGMLLFLLVAAGLFELIFSHGVIGAEVISHPYGGEIECGVEEICLPGILSARGLGVCNGPLKTGRRSGKTTLSHVKFAWQPQVPG